MATIQWDHSVHYVNDLDAVIAAFAENGLIAFCGGSQKIMNKASSTGAF